MAPHIICTIDLRLSRLHSRTCLTLFGTIIYAGGSEESDDEDMNSDDGDVTEYTDDNQSWLKPATSGSGDVGSSDDESDVVSVLVSALFRAALGII